MDGTASTEAGVREQLHTCPDGLGQEAGVEARSGVRVRVMVESAVGNSTGFLRLAVSERKVSCGHSITSSRGPWQVPQCLWITWRDWLRLPAQREAAVFAWGHSRGPAWAPTSPGSLEKGCSQPPLDQPEHRGDRTWAARGVALRLKPTVGNMTGDGAGGTQALGREGPI